MQNNAYSAIPLPATAGCASDRDVTDTYGNNDSPGILARAPLLVATATTSYKAVGIAPEVDRHEDDFA